MPLCPLCSGFQPIPEGDQHHWQNFASFHWTRPGRSDGYDNDDSDDYDDDDKDVYDYDDGVDVDENIGKKINEKQKDRQTSYF